MQLFTVEQANRTLPLVRKIVEDVVQQHRRWRETILELDLVASTARADDPRERAEELERKAQALARELDGYQRELEALGIQLKDPRLGLVISRARSTAGTCCSAGASASPKSSSGTRSTPGTPAVSRCRRSWSADRFRSHTMQEMPGALPTASTGSSTSTSLARATRWWSSAIPAARARGSIATTGSSATAPKRAA